MITGEEVLEELGRHGVDFVGELHPYDRKRIEQELDYAIDMSDTAARDRENAIQDFGQEVIERLKVRVSSELSRLCDNGSIDAKHFAEIETAVASGVVDLVYDALSEEW